MTGSVDYETFPPDVSSEILDFLSSEDPFLPKVPSGNKLNCHDWPQEAALRLLLNYTLLQVKVHLGRAPLYNFEYIDLINWESLKKNIDSLLRLKNDETLFLRNDQPSLVIKTDPLSPRVISLSSFTQALETKKENSFRVYEQLNLQNWDYSGIIETLSEQQHFFSNLAQERCLYGDLQGKLVVSSGFGHLGTALALGVTANGGVSLVIDANRKIIEKRVNDGFCSRMFEDLDSAFDVAIDCKRNGQAKVIGLVANSAEVFSELINKGIIPDFVTDMTHADDPLNGYIPSGYSFSDAQRIRRTDPHYYKNISTHSMMIQVRAMIELQKRGAFVFEYGNGLRQKAYERGLHNAFAIPEIISEQVFPILTANTPIRMKWLPLSADNEDIFLIDDLISSRFMAEPDLAKLNDLVYKVNFGEGLLARKCRIAPDTCRNLALEINLMVKEQEISAPVLLNFSSFSYFPDEELTSITKLPDSSEAILSCRNGADWLSLNQSGNYRQLNSFLIADGSPEFETKLSLILNSFGKKLF